MQIKYRIGIMPGPWPVGPPGEGADFFWRLIDLCERTEIDSIWFSDRLSSPIPVLEPMTRWRGGRAQRAVSSSGRAC